MNQFLAAAFVPFGLFILLCIERGIIIAIKRYGSKRFAYWATTDVRSIIRTKLQERRSSREGRANFQ